MRTQLRRRSISDFSYSPLAAALALALAPQAAEAGVTYNVTSTADSGAGSLRATIIQANGACSPSNNDVIQLPGGPFTISVSTQLPTINCAGLTLVGNAVPAYPAELTVDPAYAGMVSNGVTAELFLSTPVTVQGMVIHGFSDAGITGSVSANNNVIYSNGTGIDVETYGALIQSNTIYANGTGIYTDYGGFSITQNTVYQNSNGIVFEFESSQNGSTGSIDSNYIGTNSAGGSLAGNSACGITSYGGALTITGNTISNNTNGICLGSDAGSTISGNKIGVDPTGMSALPNHTGIVIEDSSGTMIGTNGQNIISGNVDDPIDVYTSTSIQIYGNLIGTDATGSAAILNGYGIYGACDTDLEVGSNVIGVRYGGAAIEFDGVTGGGSNDIVGNHISVTGGGAQLGSADYGIYLGQGDCVAPGMSLRAKRGLKKSGTLQKRSHGAGPTIRAKTDVLPAGATSNLMISGNTISYSAFDGILINGGYDSFITANTITSNERYGVSIFSGTGISIIHNAQISGNGSSKNVDLDWTGSPAARPNNSGGPGTPNDGQNYPDSITANVVGSNINVGFTLTSAPGTYIVEVCDAGPALPGCANWLNSTTVTITGTSKTGSFLNIPKGSITNISLSATSPTGDTSEFSPTVAVVSAPNVSISPTSPIDFGTVGIGSSSAEKTISIMSTGSQAYVIYGMQDSECSYGGVISICGSGGFTCHTTCAPESGYANGQGCSIFATFNPSSTGLFSDTIAICDNVGPHSITLTGTGVIPAPVTISPASFDFGSVLIGSVSATEDFTITNPGEGTVTLSTPVTADAFVMTNNSCGPQLAAGASCIATVDFVPTAGGAVSGTLSVSANASEEGPPAAPAVAQLTGTGVAQAALTLPGAIDFGAYTAGATPITQTVVLTNKGNAPLSFSATTITGPFGLSNGCTSDLQPNQSCTLVLTYSDSDLGPQTGTLVVASNAVGGSASIPLTARTVAAPVPIITVSPKAMGFGSRLLGSQSTTQRITVANIGNSTATLGSIVPNLGDFVVANTTCGVSLAPASTCFADVAFQPAGFGPRMGTILVISNAASSPDGVTVSGTGCRPFNASTARLGTSFGCAP